MLTHIYRYIAYVSSAKFIFKLIFATYYGAFEYVRIYLYGIQYRYILSGKATSIRTRTDVGMHEGSK